MTDYYVGFSGSAREVFISDTEPTNSTHGDKYDYVCGPFLTRSGANWAAMPGSSWYTIDEAEAHAEALEQRDNELPVYS